MPNDILRINNMTFHAFHGVWEEEQEIGQRFEVDLELNVDAARVAESDKLKHTVDLSAIFEKVEAVVVKGKFRLIETMSERIANEILKDFPVTNVLVRVRKPHAPIRGIQDGIEVEIRRARRGKEL